MSITKDGVRLGKETYIQPDYSRVIGGDTVTEPRDPELDPDVPNEPVPTEPDLEPEVGETDTDGDPA